MPEPPSPETLAWLRHAASCGHRDAQTMLHVLGRLDALEQRPIPGTVELAAPTPEAAPVATDAELLEVAEPERFSIHAYRACYDLGRQHGAAAAQPAPVTTGEQWDALANRLWDQYATTGPGGNQFMLVGDFGTALELARQHGAAQPPAAQPAPPVAPAGGLVERVTMALERSYTLENDWSAEASAAIREVITWLRKKEADYSVIRWLERELDQ